MKGLRLRREVELPSQRPPVGAILLVMSFTTLSAMVASAFVVHVRSQAMAMRERQLMTYDHGPLHARGPSLSSADGPRFRFNTPSLASMPVLSPPCEGAASLEQELDLLATELAGQHCDAVADRTQRLRIDFPDVQLFQRSCDR